MSRLSKTNYLFAMFIFLSLINAVGGGIQAVERYGWVFEKTTIIGEDVSTGTINMRSEIWTYATLAILGVIMVKNGRTVDSGIPIDSSDIGDIEFPNVVPENWYMDTTDTYLGVVIDGCEIRIPRERIAAWIKDMEESE